MSLDFKEVIGGGGGGGNKRKYMIIGIIGILVIVVFRRSTTGATQPAGTELMTPQQVDLPTYPNLDQTSLDQQFSNYLAIADQTSTNKFMALNDSFTALQTHMDTNNTALQKKIMDELHKTTVHHTKTTTPVTPPKSGSSGIHLISAKTKFATPKGGWNNHSVVDYLKSKGYKSDEASRNKYAHDAGMKNFKGTASENKQLLMKIKATK